MRSWLVVGMLLSAAANAADLCELYVEFCPGYSRKVVPGGSYPSFSDTFNVNPASIPTDETPIGIEAIQTLSGDRTGAKTNFALIKGFNKAGLGIANNSDSTLYSYNVLQGFEGTEYKDAIGGFRAENSVMSSLNIGSAINPFSKNMLPLLSSPNLGLNLRYNELTKHWDFQYGIGLNWTYLTLGASYKNSEGTVSSVADDAGNSLGLPTISTTSYTAATKLGVFAAEYTMLDLDTADPLIRTLPFFSKPVKIFTALLDIDKLHLSYARREAYNVLGSKVITTLIGAQLQLLKKLAIAYQKNYIPGTSSISVQILF